MSFHRLKQAILLFFMMLAGCDPSRGEKPPRYAVVGPGGSPHSESIATISGMITLNPRLQSLVKPTDTLFIIAKGRDGGPPIAVKKTTSSHFPMPFEIGPADRMAGEEFKGPLQITVRIDQDGVAGPESAGDLIGKSNSYIEPGNHFLNIEITTQIPHS